MGLVEEKQALSDIANVGRRLAAVNKCEPEDYRKALRIVRLLKDGLCRPAGDGLARLESIEAYLYAVTQRLKKR